jgi:predicted  nucleic acid-binding Zn-ribbon protein
MKHVIKALKWATRHDELRYLESEIVKITNRLEEEKEELLEIINKRDKLIEEQKEVKQFIALHDTENK